MLFRSVSQSRYYRGIISMIFKVYKLAIDEGCYSAVRTGHVGNYDRMQMVVGSEVLPGGASLFDLCPGRRPYFVDEV